jgi:hypothetical protein
MLAMNKKNSSVPAENSNTATPAPVHGDDASLEMEFSLEDILAEFGSKPVEPQQAVSPVAHSHKAAPSISPEAPSAKKTETASSIKADNVPFTPPTTKEADIAKIAPSPKQEADTASASLQKTEEPVKDSSLKKDAALGKGFEKTPNEPIPFRAAKTASAESPTSVLMPEDVSVSPVEDGPVIDVSAFDVVYERKQKRIHYLRKKLLQAERAESRKRRKNPPVVAVAVKTGPIPLPPGIKAQLIKERLDKRAGLKTRSEKPVRKPRPAINPLSMLRKLDRKKSSLILRMSLVLVLCVPLFYLSAADALYLPSFPGSSPVTDPFLHTVISLSLLGACALIGLDILVSGFSRMVMLRPNADSLVFISTVASIGHCVSYLLNPTQTLFAPFCLLPAFGIFMSLLSQNLSLKHSIRSLRSCYKLQRSRVLAPLPEEYDEDQIYALANAKSFQGFYRSFTERDAAETTMLWYAPIMAVATLFLAIYCSVGLYEENGPPFFWCWSLMTSLTPALGFFLCTALPYASVSKRLFKNGVLFGGRKAVSRMASRAFVLMTDEELFPGDGVSINGFKLMDPSRKEEALSYSASVLDAAHTALARPFIRLAADEYAPIRPVSQLKFNEMGGIIALVDNKQVMIGTGSFIQRCGIKIPQDIKLRTAVFCAIDAELVAVFAVRYQALPRSDYALTLLTENGYIPVLATRDFNVTASFLQSRFGIASSDVVYPPAELRASLSDPGLSLEADGIVVTRGAGDSLAEALVACNRYRAASRAGLIFSLLSSLLGLGMAVLMSFNVWQGAAAPLNLFIYYVLWLVPILLLSGWSNKF